MTALSYTAFGATDIGKERAENEDHFWFSNTAQVYAVADGLGGLPEGALASQLATESLKKIVDTSEIQKPLPWDKILKNINSIVFNKGETIDSELGIGTTFTAAHILNKTLYTAHVGDSRCSLFKEDSVTHLTPEHTMAQRILDNLKPGEPEPKIPPYFHHTLTACIGQKEDVIPALNSNPIAADDCILLYTDGLSKVISDKIISQEIKRAETPEVLVTQLIKLANKAGGPDNITVIAIFVGQA